MARRAGERHLRPLGIRWLHSLNMDNLPGAWGRTPYSGWKLKIRCWLLPGCCAKIILIKKLRPESSTERTYGETEFPGWMSTAFIVRRRHEITCKSRAENFTHSFRNLAGHKSIWDLRIWSSEPGPKCKSRTHRTRQLSGIQRMVHISILVHFSILIRVCQQRLGSQFVASNHQSDQAEFWQGPAHKNAKTILTNCNLDRGYLHPPPHRKCAAAELQ